MAYRYAQLFLESLHEEREVDPRYEVQRDLVTAAVVGNVDAVIALLDRPRENLLGIDHSMVVGSGLPINALFAAARDGHIDIVQTLVEAGADPNWKQGSSGASPLHIAAATNNAEVCAYLVAQGADPEAEDEIGTRPLDRATANACAAATEALLACGAISTPDRRILPRLFTNRTARTATMAVLDAHDAKAVGAYFGVMCNLAWESQDEGAASDQA